MSVWVFFAKTKYYDVILAEISSKYLTYLLLCRVMCTILYYIRQVLIYLLWPFGGDLHCHLVISDVKSRSRYLTITHCKGPFRLCIKRSFELSLIYVRLERNCERILFKIPRQRLPYSLHIHILLYIHTLLGFFPQTCKYYLPNIIFHSFFFYD